MLEKLGHYVDVVANGSEAVEAVFSVPYDLVLMDCQMPEMDGYDATRMIRANVTHAFHSIPIVAMTANAMQGDREKCIQAGMSDYITKPFRPDDLANVIHRVIPIAQKV